MKKPALSAFILYLLVPLFAVFPETPDITSYKKTETGYYLFHTDGNSQLPSSFFTGCDKNTDFYNNFLRFPGKSTSDEKMRIFLFDSAEGLDAFLKARGLPGGKPVNLFLNKTAQAGSFGEGRLEIAAVEDSVFSRDFRINCFYQFFRSSIPSPPKWLEAGIALYLEEELKISAARDIYKNTAPGKAAIFSQLAKLIKQQGKEKTGGQIKDILTGSTYADTEMYLTQSWVIVEFMMDMKYGPSYSRVLWDSLPLLKPASDSAGNSRMIADYFSQWIDIPLFTERLLAFIDESEKLEDIYAKGKKLYEDGVLTEADNIFSSILHEYPDDNFSLYYKGLIRHSQGKYDEAIEYYSLALSSGGDAALISYAAGLSFYAKGDTGQAGFFLKKAAEHSPERFKVHTEPLLEVISGLK